MANCQNCNEIVTNNFCSNCGQSIQLKRINREYAFQELLNLIGYENGFIYTVKELLVRPGKTVKEYINVNRTKITKPITFLILSSVIYTIIYQYFNVNIFYNKEMKSLYGDSTYYKISVWVTDNYGYANLLMLFPITLWTKLLFRKNNYNFYETFIVICYFMAESMLFLTLSTILNKYFAFPKIMYDNIMLIIVIIYISWAISLFYGKSIKTFLKAFIAYSLGIITFQLVIIIISNIYDIFF